MGACELALACDLHGRLGAGRLHVECLRDRLPEHVRARFRRGVLDDGEPDPAVAHVHEVPHSGLDPAGRVQHELRQTGVRGVGDAHDGHPPCGESLRFAARVGPAQDDRAGDPARGECRGRIQPVPRRSGDRDVSQREDAPVEGERERSVGVDIRPHQRVRDDGDESGAAASARARRLGRFDAEAAQGDRHGSARVLRHSGPIAQHTRHRGQGEPGGLCDAGQRGAAHRSTAVVERRATSIGRNVGGTVGRPSPGIPSTVRAPAVSASAMASASKPSTVAGGRV